MVCAAPGIPVRGPSGSSAHFRGMARAFARRTSVRIVAARLADQRGEHGQIELPMRAPRPPLFPTRRFPERRERAFASRVARIEGPVPELIYERWTLFSEAGRFARRGLPRVLEVNAPLLEERLRFESVRDEGYTRKWQARSLEGADLYACVSPWLAQWVEDQGVPHERIEVVPNGTEALMGERTARGDFVVGFVGSMKPWHGADRVERLARQAGGEALLVGDPPVGEQAVADAIASMDVALAPYRADAPAWFCPLKVAAYRAQGTPVVATRVGAMERWVGEGGTVVPDDDGLLVEAIRSWRGRRARASLRSWDDVANEVLAALASRGCSLSFR